MSTLSRPQRRLELRQAVYCDESSWKWDDRERLIFLHVAKSGGTSLDEYFTSFFAASAALPPEKQVRRIADWDADDWDRYRYFKLEWPYQPTFRRVGSAHFVTMLRDPIKRLISLFQHLSRPDDHSQQYETVRQRRAPILEAARTLELDEWVRLEPPHPGAYLRHAYLGMATIGVANLVNKTESELDQLLQVAKENLCRRFACVGIVEEYARSKELFCRTFGLPLDFAAGVEKLNSAPESVGCKPSPCESTLQRIRMENRWDCELYSFAKSRLESRLHELSTAQSASQAADFRLEEAPTTEGELVLTAAELRGLGLYRCEVTADELGFRWFGGRPITRLAFGAQLPSTGTLWGRLSIHVAAAPLSRIQIRVNGQATKNVRVVDTSTGKQLQFEASIDSMDVRDDIHWIEIEGPLCSPSTKDALDQRTLLVAVSELSLRWNADPAGSNAWNSIHRVSA
ncbi:MAG: sulfotransferase family 2 domain-containing protein [Planctomycetaceae bacterium]